MVSSLRLSYQVNAKHLVTRYVLALTGILLSSDYPFSDSEKEMSLTWLGFVPISLVLG